LYNKSRVATIPANDPSPPGYAGVNGNPEAGFGNKPDGRNQIPWYCKLSAKELQLISGGKITGTTASARKSCLAKRSQVPSIFLKRLDFWEICEPDGCSQGSSSGWWSKEIVQ